MCQMLHKIILSLWMWIDIQATFVKVVQQGNYLMAESHISDRYCVRKIARQPPDSKQDVKRTPDCISSRRLKNGKQPPSCAYRARVRELSLDLGRNIMSLKNSLTCTKPRTLHRTITSEALPPKRCFLISLRKHTAPLPPKSRIAGLF